MTAPERAPLGAALALLLTLISLTGPLSPVVMATFVALLTVLLGIAWPGLLELRSAVGTAVVMAGTGIAGAVIVSAPSDRIAPMTGIVMACAVGVFASFVHQMLRRDRRDLTASLTGTVAGVFAAGVAACWVLAQAQAAAEGRAALVSAIAAGLAATLLINATALPAGLRFVLSAGAGAGVTAALASALLAVSLPLAIGLGLVVAIGGSCAHLLAGSSLVAREPVPSLAVAVVPVATIGVVAHLAVMLLP
ncbi:hypothetical protein ACFQS2_05430 [Brachybacterium sp. GCM10030267]|uniref:hypothetical protein n=1 Tax=unclassified Brachybacterium TaxID=2623841 RepID=UPI003607C9B3